MHNTIKPNYTIKLTCRWSVQRVQQKRTESFVTKKINILVFTIHDRANPDTETSRRKFVHLYLSNN